MKAHPPCNRNCTRESGAALKLPLLLLAPALLTGVFAQKVTETAGSGVHDQPVPDATHTSSHTLWVELTNGNRFSGKATDAELTLIEVESRRRIVPDEWTRCERMGSGRFMVLLTNQQTVSSSFALKEFVFHLDIGPQVSIVPATVSSIWKERCQPEKNPDSAAPASGGGSPMEGMVWIAPGQFTMGSPRNEGGRDPDEGPQTKVIFSKGFWMSRHEVTQAEFQRVMAHNPSTTGDDPSRPVDRVNWLEAVQFCRRLTEMEDTAGRLPGGYIYRLPTEAEWEYACRAGSSTRFSFGEDVNESQLEAHAWFSRNSESVTHPVGKKRANSWGLFDMHGNVWEWCLDRWEGALPGGTVTNQARFSQGNLRAARGGSWLYDAKACRSANRDDYGPANRCSDIGFRIVLAPQE